VVNVRPTTTMSECCTTSVASEIAADHPLRGIFHPLGAAFFSNASYTETIKIVDQTNISIQPFSLAGAREMFRYNYSDGAIEANPSLVPQFLASLSAEIPRYTALWNQRFQPISAVNYKVRYTDACGTLCTAC
jgi:hypothetical protein